MKLALALVILAPLSIAVLRKPFIGLWMMVFLNPMVTLFKVSQNSSILKYFGYLLFMAWLINILITDKKIRLGPAKGYIILFSGWATITLFWSFNLSASFTKSFLLWELVFFYFLSYNLLNTRKRIDYILIAHTFGATIATIIGFKNLLTGGANWMYYRMTIEGLNENTFGVNCAMAIIAVLYLLATSKNKGIAYKFMLIFLGLFNSLGLLFSGSRGAWIAVSVAGIFFTISYADVEKRGYKKITVLLMYSLLLISIFALSWYILVKFFPNNAMFLKNRFIEALHPHKGDPIMSRFMIWWLGLKIFIKNFLTGVGVGAFPYATLVYFEGFYDPHSVFIGITAELGIVGIVLFLLILFKFFSISYKDKTYFKALKMSLLFLMVVISAKASFLWGRECWIIFALIASSSYIMKKEALEHRFLQ